jgi:hypothetical protein
MPIWGFAKSLSLYPTGYNIARLGARLRPSNTTEEKGRMEVLFFEGIDW